METGGVCASRYLVSADTFSIGKGLIWLFLAAITYIPPVVRGASPMYLSLRAHRDFAVAGVHLSEPER